MAVIGNCRRRRPEQRSGGYGQHRLKDRGFVSFAAGILGSGGVRNQSGPPEHKGDGLAIVYWIEGNRTDEGRSVAGALYQRCAALRTILYKVEAEPGRFLGREKGRSCRRRRLIHPVAAVITERGTSHSPTEGALHPPGVRCMASRRSPR